MNKHTNEAIIEFVRNTWEEQAKVDYHYYSHLEIEVITNSEDKVQVKLYDMYGAPTLNLALLMKLADFFGTKNINDDNRYSYGGCDTCDYGSEYGFTLTVRPEV